MDDNQHWEQICQRCGECCFEKKIDKKGTVLTTSVPCRFLDIHTRNCRIYHQRLQAEEDCIKLTPDNLAGLDWLPLNCAYRKHLNL
ncbi:hypothetical protein SAMN02745165_00026 [Malonomonas rubra DSM 5091]|uniref:Uncharacterized protein n=1 Tax=Malonomonas rubra DSM 5091 TaxID=1122189 RepID=A0A1M6B3M1_MALRU|nr:hypothetical protein SAMN02745165_00026 [Malonomonas rubra DSM 5091]